MFKNFILLLLLFLQILFASGGDYVYNAESFENDKWQQDFTSPWNDILKKAGIQESLNKAMDYVSEVIKNAEKYDDFYKDWQTLKTDYLNPLKVIQFLKNTTLPAIIRGGAVLEKSLKNLYRRVMIFTLEKCDLLLGREANLHPWNAIRQGKETVSFLVFVYGVSLSLILFKLCSFFNFISWISVGYLVYASTGPFWCFKWLVFTTGLFWYLFDLILTYPFHASIAFLILYLLPRFYSTSKHFGSTAIFKPNKAVIDEFRLLKGKVNKIEDKTDEIKKKVDELETLFQRMNFNKNC